MPETTQLNKVRQKRIRVATGRSKTKDEEIPSSLGANYFYPKNNLYTRQEFELLDTIYSDEPPTIHDYKNLENGDFWPENKEEYLTMSNPKTNLITNLAWFLGGVMVTSVIWLIYFQVSVNHIKTKMDTQIVFQNSASISTDKTVDKQIANKLKKENNVVKETVLNKEVPKVAFKFPTFFAPKPKQELIVQETLTQNNKKEEQIVQPEKQEQKVETPSAGNTGAARYHIVSSGDSLWTIAKKYYSDPSPRNVERLMKANEIKKRKMASLYIGQKIIVPR